MARKSKRRKRRNETAYYVVRIEEWSWDYSFGVDQTKHFDDPYGEYKHLQVKGRLVEPVGIVVDKLTLTFLPSVWLNHANRQQNQPSAIGHLTLRSGVLDGIIPFPDEALDQVLNMLIARRFRYVIARGSPFFRRESTVYSLRMTEALSEDDLPAKS